MSIILLIRHGSNPTVGKRLAGRSAGIHLDELGRAQAEALPARLSQIPIDAVHSSPLDRTFETALPLARQRGLEVVVDESFYEVEIGPWAGLDFERLRGDDVWEHYNNFRSGTRPPQGEILVEVQQRVVTGIERLRRQYPAGVVAIFSHGDPIKSAIAHYAGFPLDYVQRFEVSLVSISMISISDYGPRILCVNNLGDLPKFLLTL